MKNSKNQNKDVLKLTKEQENLVSKELTKNFKLIEKYQDETKREEALKDVEYVKLCASLVNFHVLLRTALKSLQKYNEELFVKQFSVYVMIQNLALPKLPDLELFFSKVASARMEKPAEKMIKAELEKMKSSKEFKE